MSTAGNLTARQRWVLLVLGAVREPLSSRRIEQEIAKLNSPTGPLLTRYQVTVTAAQLALKGLVERANPDHLPVCWKITEAGSDRVEAIEGVL